MKKIIFICLTLAFSSVLLAQSQQLTNVITTRGHAECEVEPNQIEVSVNLSEADSKGKLSLAELDQRFMKSLDYAKVNAKTDVKIVSQSSEAHKKTDAFQYKSYVVKLNSAEKLLTLFAGFDKYYVQNAEVTKVWNTNYVQIEQELQLKAVRDAKASATKIAGAIDQTIGRAIIINEGYSPRPNFAMNNMRVKGVASDEAMNDTQLQLPNEMRTIKLEQTITITFELK